MINIKFMFDEHKQQGGDIIGTPELKTIKRTK